MFHTNFMYSFPSFLQMGFPLPMFYMMHSKLEISEASPIPSSLLTPTPYLATQLCPFSPRKHISAYSVLAPMSFITSLLNHCNSHLIHHLTTILSIPVTALFQTGVKYLSGTYLTPGTMLGIGSLTWMSLTSTESVFSGWELWII